MRQSRCQLAYVALATCLPLLLTGCSRHLEPPAQYGELLVAVRETPAYYYEEVNGTAKGFDHDLAELFARDLGVSARFVVARDHAELIKLVKRGSVHFAAAAPLDSDAELRYSAVLRDSRQLIVRYADAPAVDDVDALAGKRIAVLAGSPQVAALRALGGGHPPFVIEERDNMNEIDLLERISQKKSELAATDTTHFNIATNFYPEIEEGLELEGRVRFAWAFPRSGDIALYSRAQEFIRRIHQDGTLARMRDRYFGHILRINSEGVTSFLESVAAVLPRFRGEFIAAQELTGVDWRLLASLAYQESRWDPLATSPTGVRGIMMLTEDTADHLNVKNRLDAKQSIRAGAKYLAELIEQVPRQAREPDRTWLALAAYNLGQGHMNGARAVAAKLNRDPNSWYEMKQVLPLLAKQKYYDHLKSGRARGGEAVIMVENVRTFHDILSRFEPAYAAPGYTPPIFTIPPMYERRDSGTVMLPSPF